MKEQVKCNEETNGRMEQLDRRQKASGSASENGCEKDGIRARDNRGQMIHRLKMKRRVQQRHQMGRSCHIGNGKDDDPRRDRC